MQSGNRRAADWADLATSLGHDRLLVVGRRSDEGSEAVPASNGAEIRVATASWDPVDQQLAPFPVVCIGNDLVGEAAEVLRAAVHQAVQHIAPGGVFAVHPVVAAELAPLCDEFGLDRAPTCRSHGGAVVYRRPERTTVHDLLWAARATIGRVAPQSLAGELGGAARPIVVDIRTHTDRCRSGVIRGSIHVPRTVLEWHLDPVNGYPHPAVAGHHTPLVIVCNGGYSSSLAAANLIEIGFTDVRDLIGGMRAWLRAGLAVVDPDHAHLDLSPCTNIPL